MQDTLSICHPVYTAPHRKHNLKSTTSISGGAGETNPVLCLDQWDPQQSCARSSAIPAKRQDQQAWLL